MATIRNRVSIYSHLLSNCSNDRFGFKHHYVLQLINELICQVGVVRILVPYLAVGSHSLLFRSDR